MILCINIQNIRGFWYNVKMRFVGTSLLGWWFIEQLKREARMFLVLNKKSSWVPSWYIFFPQTGKLPAKRKFLVLNLARTWYRSLQAEYILFTDWWPLRVSEVRPFVLRMIQSIIFLRMNLSFFWVLKWEKKESIHLKLGVLISICQHNKWLCFYMAKHLFL